MGMPSFPPLVNVNQNELIGQPFKVAEWYPVALVRCNCSAHQPLLLRGIGNITQCPECKRGVVIAGLIADPKTMQVGLNISGVLLRTPDNGQGDALIS